MGYFRFSSLSCEQTTRNMSLSIAISRLQQSPTDEPRKVQGRRYCCSASQGCVKHTLPSNRALWENGRNPFLYVLVQISSGSFYLLYSASISTLDMQSQFRQNSHRLVPHSLVFSSLCSHIIMKDKRGNAIRKNSFSFQLLLRIIRIALQMSLLQLQEIITFSE